MIPVGRAPPFFSGVRVWTPASLVLSFVTSSYRRGVNSFFYFAYRCSVYRYDSLDFYPRFRYPYTAVYFYLALYALYVLSLSGATSRDSFCFFFFFTQPHSVLGVYVYAKPVLGKDLHELEGDFLLDPADLPSASDSGGGGGGGGGGDSVFYGDDSGGSEVRSRLCVSLCHGCVLGVCWLGVDVEQEIIRGCAGVCGVFSSSACSCRRWSQC